MPAPTPRPGILDIAPYIGGESKIPGKDKVIKLASNESAIGPSPAAIAAYSALAGELHRYPDGGATELRQALALRHGIDPERIVCGNGSDELIQLLVKAYAGPGDELVYSAHGFLVYALAAKAAGVTPVTAPERNRRSDVDALLAAVTPRTRAVFIANPNNPTGSYLPADEIARLHAGLPAHVLLVIDAAYAEFVGHNDYTAGAELVTRFDNVVMLRTFSKLYGLGGLRLGWAYCSPDVADVLGRVRGPFNINAAALAAGLAALNDVQFVAEALHHNHVWRAWFTDQLTALGLDVTPSAGNFVLARFPADPAHNADAAFDHLKANGILARKMHAYDLGDSLRISIGTEVELKAVIAALAGFLG